MDRQSKDALLQQLFKATPDDVAANRAGVLSDRQIARRIGAVKMLRMVALVIALGAATPLILRLSGADVSLGLVIPTAILSGAELVLSTWSTRKLTASASAPVTAVTGKLQALKGARRTDIRMDDHPELRLPVIRNVQWDPLLDDDVYVAYVTQPNNGVVSMEVYRESGLS